MLRGLLTGQHFKKQLPWESKMEVKNMLVPNQTQKISYGHKLADIIKGKEGEIALIKAYQNVDDF